MAVKDFSLVGHCSIVLGKDAFLEVGLNAAEQAAGTFGTCPCLGKSIGTEFRSAWLNRWLESGLFGVGLNKTEKVGRA